MDGLGITISVLADNLKEKRDVLNQILNISENQNMLLHSPNPDEEIAMFFGEMVKTKQELIDKVVELDNVFQGMFEAIGDAFEENAGSHRDRILAMQETIAEVMELDVKIRAMEQKNRDLVGTKAVKGGSGQRTAAMGRLMKEYEKNKKKEN